MGRKNTDIESDAGKLEIQTLHGYPSLTRFITSDHDRTTLVFRRFDDLAVRNLLYLQSELAELKKKQESFDEEDRSIKAGREMKGCAMSWLKSQEMAKAGDAKQQERVDLAKDIRVKLKEYREALLFESTMASIKPPPKRTFEAIRHALYRKDDQNNEYSILTGSSQDMYSSNDDLVLLNHPGEQDRLTQFMHHYLPVLFTSGRRTDDTVYISEKRITRVVSIISIAMAVILLLVAIISLHIVSRPATKIALVAVFMVVFAGSVGLLTTAKRSEIFAATAAYAAVLVVFVSGNLSGSN
ncbi:hypothetical protein BT63DRAFT_427199 [Microthyrium microscopicum]|uniref:DUF6594 domain-containing protein n=1 Tax=Microthyrium microscopicum TaxID=703497 RepID=A0A6A6U571_9PEZI|nr:hypothetical protein BT63DRAFT_427199 [Microthyrium microscopicum]